MKSLFLTSLMLSLAAPLAAQLITLKQTGPAYATIPFSIEVWVENSVVPVGSELLTFAFDVETSSNLALLAATVGDEFFDDFGLTPYAVAGSAFPGYSGPDVLLASLEVLGSAPGPAFLRVDGPIDLFGGLKYVNFEDPLLDPLELDYPIEALLEFELKIVPETSAAVLLGVMLLTGWMVIRRR